MKSKPEGIKQSDRRPNLALYLTASRILLSPVFVALFMIGAPWAPGACLGIVLLMELSDLADGYAARSRKQVTPLGKLLDPYADSIYRLTCYLCFLWRDMIPLVPMVVLFYRDSTIALTRILWSRSGVALSARISGKIKAWVQAIGIVLILLLATLRQSWAPSDEYVIVSYVVMAAALISGIDYVIASRRIYMQSIRGE